MVTFRHLQRTMNLNNCIDRQKRFIVRFSFGGAVVFVSGKQVLSDCHLLVEIQNVDDMFSDEAMDMTILGQFSVKSDAEKIRLMVANNCSHGTRLVIFSVQPHERKACCDVMVVVLDEVN